MFSPSSHLRIAMVGVDTSHAVEFTARLNDCTHPEHVPGARVVRALPMPTPDMPMSRDRVQGFTATVRDTYGVQIVPDMTALLEDVDAVMVLSLDGRAHLEQVKALLTARVPLFVDKPVAASLKDVAAIYQLTASAGVPLFSASALRWYPELLQLANAGLKGVSGALSYGPAPKQPGHTTLFFYGIHPTEALFALLGQGCESVVATSSDAAMVVTGRWQDGRIGTLYAMHTWPADYKVTLFGQEQVREQSLGINYAPLVREIVQFFHTRQPPVSPEQTLEIYAFMEAADESVRCGGCPVQLRAVLESAKP